MPNSKMPGKQKKTKSQGGPKFQNPYVQPRIMNSGGKQGRVELKYWEQFSSAGIDANGTLTNITDMVRGTDVVNRIANQVRLKELQIRFKAVIHPSQSSTNIRVLLVLDKQGYNSPAISDILEPAYLGSAYTTVATYRWDYAHRFTVLMDKILTLTQAAFQNATYENVIPLNITSYNIGASTTFSNHVHILIISSETNVLQLPVYYYTTRTLFTDD